MLLTSKYVPIFKKAVFSIGSFSKIGEVIEQPVTVNNRQIRHNANLLFELIK